MQIRIEVKNYKGETPYSQMLAVFDANGGNIGRSDGCSLTLPDAECIVSLKHATITFENGVYYLHDHSTNGTSVNDDYFQNEKMELRSGDVIEIGEYVLATTIEPVSENTVPDFDPGDLLEIEDIFEPKPPADAIRTAQNPPNSASDSDVEIKLPDFFGSGASMQDHYAANLIADEQDASPPDDAPGIPDDFNPMDLLSNAGKSDSVTKSPAKISAPLTAPAIQQAPLQKDQKPADEIKQAAPPDASAVPKRKKRPKQTPAELHPVESPAQQEKTLPIKDHPPHDRKPVDTAPGSASELPHAQTDPNAVNNNDQLIKLLLETMGIIDEHALRPEDAENLIKTLGKVFRELVDGLRTLLRARAEARSLLGIKNPTMIEKAGNNPLKFLPTVEDVLKHMLINDKSGYIDGVSAVRKGYQDVKNHELAITEGARSALRKLLIELDPQKIEATIGKSLIAKKSRCWDEYRRVYHDVIKETSNRLFDKEFARIYEELIKKIDDTNVAG